MRSCMCQFPTPPSTGSCKNNPKDTSQYHIHIAVVALVRVVLFWPLLLFMALTDALRFAHETACTLGVLAAALYNAVRLLITRRSGAPPLVRGT